MRLHRGERPGEIDGCRPRRDERGGSGGDIGVRRVFAHGKREPIGGGDADQWRTSHEHMLDRLRRRGERAELDHCEFMRQARLIDDRHACVIGRGPDSSIRLAVDAHQKSFKVVTQISQEAAETGAVIGARGKGLCAARWRKSWAEVIGGSHGLRSPEDLLN